MPAAALKMGETLVMVKCSSGSYQGEGGRERMYHSSWDKVKKIPQTMGQKDTPRASFRYTTTTSDTKLDVKQSPSILGNTSFQ